jgi:hypothetical protein
MDLIARFGQYIFVRTGNCPKAMGVRRSFWYTTCVVALFHEARFLGRKEGQYESITARKEEKGPI